MLHSSDRLTYRPSGRCDLARFPLALAVLVATAAGIATIYCVQIFWFYFSGLSVFVPVLLVAGGARMAVQRGHWRSPALAGVLGAVCGLAGYLGYFYIDQCLRWGVPWTALDRLPSYVAFRMETDNWERMSKGAMLVPQQPAAGVRPERPLAKANIRSWNWAGFAFEALALALVALASGVVAVRVPYSETRRRWCSRERLTLAPGDVAALRQALAEETIDRWVDSKPQKVAAHLPHGKVLVWYTPAEEGKDADPDVYLTVGEAQPVLLRPEEAAAFVSLLPGVGDLAGPSLRQMAAEAEQADDPASARVWPVPPPYAGQAETPRNRLLNWLLVRALLVLPALLAVLLLPGGSVFLWTFVVANNLLPSWIVVVYMLAVGIPFVLFFRWWSYPGRSVPLAQSIRYCYRNLRKAVAARPQPLVAADDPRAVFCEMLPRRAWGTGKVKPGEYNNGLLLVDAGSRGIAFEGDYERYWVPADAVLACDIEVHPSSSATTAGFWAVVLRVRLGSGAWEFPFFPLANIEGTNPWERAMNLNRRIESVCSRSFASQTAAPPQQPEPTVIG